MWGRLGLQEMPTPASIEHSRALLRETPSPEKGSDVIEDGPDSPMEPRNLFGTDNDDVASKLASSEASEQGSEDVALGVDLNIAAEDYADDTYMLTIRLVSLLAMLVATSKWLQLTGQEVNARQSLAFSPTSSVRRKPEGAEAALDGVQMPVKQEFGQLGVGVRTVLRRVTGPLL